MREGTGAAATRKRDGNSLMTNPEKAQLIQPPIRIMGRTLVRLPFIMSVSIPESADTHAQITAVKYLATIRAS